jgi:hypothetical protein
MALGPGSPNGTGTGLSTRQGAAGPWHPGEFAPRHTGESPAARAPWRVRPPGSPHGPGTGLSTSQGAAGPWHPGESAPRCTDETPAARAPWRARRRGHRGESGRRALHVAVTESGRRRCQWPLQEAAVTGGRHRKRPSQAAVAGSGRRRWQRPLHKQCPEAGRLNTSLRPHLPIPLAPAASHTAVERPPPSPPLLPRSSFAPHRLCALALLY